MKLSIVIPVFREEAVLSATHERVPRLLGELSGRGLIEDYEVLCIDDGSRDNSLGILRELALKSPRVKVLSRKDPWVASLLLVFYAHSSFYRKKGGFADRSCLQNAIFDYFSYRFLI